jgi:hypothetical protein
VTTSTRLGLIEDIVISIVVFLVVSLRNTDGTVFQGANSNAYSNSNLDEHYFGLKNPKKVAKIEVITWVGILLPWYFKNNNK